MEWIGRDGKLGFISSRTEYTHTHTPLWRYWIGGMWDDSGGSCGELETSGYAEVD